jgi:hypothetical protein
LLDQLTTYESEANPLYYATRFVDGLREEIRSMVMIQRPTTFDVACALALVQEEAVDSSKKKEFHRFEPSANRSAQKFVFPLPLPPKWDKLLGTAVTEERQGLEVARHSSSVEELEGYVIDVLRNGYLGINVFLLYNFMQSKSYGSCYLVLMTKLCIMLSPYQKMELLACVQFYLNLLFQELSLQNL